MNKLSPHRQALYEAADAQRKLCRDWLLYIMTSSSVKTRTKDDLRAEAIERFRVSKGAFDVSLVMGYRRNGQSSLVRAAAAISKEDDADATRVTLAQWIGRKKRGAPSSGSELGALPSRERPPLRIEENSQAPQPRASPTCI